MAKDISKNPSDHLTVTEAEGIISRQGKRADKITEHYETGKRVMGFNHHKPEAHLLTDEAKAKLACAFAARDYDVRSNPALLDSHNRREQEVRNKLAYGY